MSFFVYDDELFNITIEWDSRRIFSQTIDKSKGIVKSDKRLLKVMNNV